MAAKNPLMSSSSKPIRKKKTNIPMPKKNFEAWAGFNDSA